MGLISRTNNKVIAPNSRAVDVATRAVEELTPVQQRKSHNAYMVQGFPGILYSRKHGGDVCTCGSSGRVVNSILDEKGAASPGVINELLTGASFGVEDYGADSWRMVISEVEDTTSPLNGSPFEGNPDIDGADYPIGDQSVELDDLSSMFDPSMAGFGDYACPVCFGTGWVGGYSIMYGQRHVWGTHQMGLNGDNPGELLTVDRPWAAETERVQIIATLPRGALAVTSSTLYYKDKKVGFGMTVNGVPVTSEAQFLSFCQGLPVLIELRFQRQRITHFELQFNTSQESVYFEFPKLQKSSDLQFLDLTEPFPILMSPNTPRVAVEDVLTDGEYGKALIVQSVGPWQTRSSHQLGWEVQVRVAQPYELPNILPRLNRIQTKHRTTRMVRDNSSGHRRA